MLDLIEEGGLGEVSSREGESWMKDSLDVLVFETEGFHKGVCFAWAWGRFCFWLNEDEGVFWIGGGDGWIGVWELILLFVVLEFQYWEGGIETGVDWFDEDSFALEGWILVSQEGGSWGELVVLSNEVWIGGRGEFFWLFRKIE